MIVTFRADGTPVTQGSHRLGVNRRTGRALVVAENSGALDTWRNLIGYQARMVRPSGWPTDAPMSVTAQFDLTRPKTVRRQVHTVKPDVDKLLRACFDAMTGILFDDDSQVVRVTGSKRYSDLGPPGVTIAVEALTPD